MREVFVGHEIVRLNSRLNVLTVNSDGNSHNHVLRTLDNLAIKAEKVRALKCLEAKVLVIEIPIIYNSRVQLCFMFYNGFVCIFADHGRELAISWVDIVIEV